VEVIADSNFIIALIFQDHQSHARALREWERVTRASIPLVSLLEVIYFLIKNGVDLTVVREIISDPKIAVVESTLEDLSFALKYHGRVKDYLDFNDYLVIAASRRLGLKVLTLDRKMRSKVGRRWR
jgi:predicted nucleic acid-binding protein